MIDLIGQRLGEYEIAAMLGQGGMAVVYRATQLNIKRDVAVKVIQPTLRQSTDFNARFTREAQTIAALSHPHIVKVFDYGVLYGFHLRLLDPHADTHKNLIYLVMELLNGGALSDLINQGPLDLPIARRFINEIGSALDYAHQKGVIHCDLKPDNVLFDEGQNSFLADFGIAQLLTETTEHEEESEFIAGTPHYMAPEQWYGETPSAATDIYALGIILFQMLTARLPFDADSPLQIMQKHMSGTIPDIRQFRPELPPAVQDVINRALAKAPADRYVSAGQLSTAFGVALDQRAKLSTGLMKRVDLPVAPSIAPSVAPSHATNVALNARPAIPLPEAVASPTTKYIIIGEALVIVVLLIALLALALPRLSGQGSNVPSNVPGIVDTLVAGTLTQRAVAP